MGNPSQSYGASLAIRDHTVLPATRHKWMRPAITPAKQAGTRFTYPGEMEGWVGLGGLIAAWPGIEPTTSWSQVRRPNRYATESPKVISQSKTVELSCCCCCSAVCELTCSQCRAQGGWLLAVQHDRWQEVIQQLRSSQPVISSRIKPSRPARHFQFHHVTATPTPAPAVSAETESTWNHYNATQRVGTRR